MNKQNNASKVVEFDAGLDFKKHDWYFEELKKLLTDFIENYNQCLISKLKIEQVYLSLNSLYLWVSDQLEAIGVGEDVRKKIDEIKKKVLNNEKGALKDTYDLFIDFNKYLSKTENKPKVKISREDEYEIFWRTEEIAGLKEMKKAFYDSFMLPED